MGFGDVVLLGCVILLSGGNLYAAQNISTNETLNRIQTEAVTSLSQPGRSQHATGHRSNRPQPSGPPVSYRLRSYRLRKPAASAEQQTTLQAMQEQMRSSQILQKARETIPELQEPRVRPQPVKTLLPGPNLNPPVEHRSKVLVKFEQRVPVAADSVAVRCGEGEVTVEVKQNFLGNDQLIRPGDLTLGGCPALHAADHVLHFQTELQACGSKTSTTEEALIYTFSLIYAPAPIGNTFIYKTNPAEVMVECHYRRRTYVSSDAMKPTWKPFASDVLAEQQLQFSLRLMTEDWRSPRPSGVYSMSEVMHVEASVLQGHHVPLRVYVDSCVATLTPNPNSHPSYSFINNHGCFTDAKLTRAKSFFMPRSQEDKLRFQLKAFRFDLDDRRSNTQKSSEHYITCRLRATTVSVPVDSRHKACSFLTEAHRWVASGGDNKVCGCCETSCSETRQRRGLAADAAVRWEGTATLGPILLRRNILVSRLPSEPRAASSPSRAAVCGVGTALAAALLLCIGAVVHSRGREPTAKVRT